jgi:diadenosine tetraphosphate (Ap4A) HIT family hydrolase
VFAATALSFAFVNLRPAVPGHVLVAIRHTPVAFFSSSSSPVWGSFAWGEKTAHGNNHYSVPKNNLPTPRN